MMHVLIVAADLSVTTLFDLAIAQEVSNVLDLRTAHDRSLHLLERIYHRPPKVLADVILRRVMSDWHKATDAPVSYGYCSSKLTLMVLVDHEQIDDVRMRVLSLRPDAQIEVI